MITEWEVAATSGMMGADICEDFIHGLDNDEIIHLRESAYKLIRMIRRETDKRRDEVENG